MPDSPEKPDEDEVLKRMLNTPPKPHKSNPPKTGGDSKDGPKSRPKKEPEGDAS